MTAIKTGTTAIRRNKPSSPMKLLISEMDVITWLTNGNMGIGQPVFDMGCGRGDDLEFLESAGFSGSVGYDPHHNAEKPPWEYASGAFNLVTCFYVLNVLPTHEERVEVIKECLRLVGEHGALAVAVRSKRGVNRAKKDTWVEYNNGYVTPAGTFQKGFTAGELANVLIDTGFDIVCNLHSYGEYVMVVAAESFPTEYEVPF